MSLFGDLGDGAGERGFDERIAIPDTEFDKSERLKFEKEMLGLYVSDHPLLGVEAALRRKVDCSVADAAEREDGAIVVLGGVITGLSRKFTKKGDQMAVFVLEDLDGAIEVTVFPRVLHGAGSQAGRRRDRHRARAASTAATRPGSGSWRRTCTVLEGLDTGDSAAAAPARAGDVRCSELKIHQLRRILRDHPGESPVYLHIGQGKMLRLADEFCVDLDRVVRELRVAFGHDAVML